jgi:hypothetical protein
MGALRAPEGASGSRSMGRWRGDQERSIYLRMPSAWMREAYRSKSLDFR